MAKTEPSMVEVTAAPRESAARRQVLVKLLASTVITWQEHAACAKTDAPDLWFDNDPAATTQALNICRSCPVRSQCAEHGMAFERWGTWGGLSQRARNRRRSSEARPDVEIL